MKTTLKDILTEISEKYAKLDDLRAHRANVRRSSQTSTLIPQSLFKAALKNFDDQIDAVRNDLIELRKVRATFRKARAHFKK